VTKEELEQSLLELWLSTRIPLTRAHVQYHTGVTRKRLSQWLDELVVEGVLDVDVDDDGEMIYQVPGAKRPATGPTTFTELGSTKTKTKTKTKAKAGSRSPEEALEDLQAELVVNQAKGLVKKAGRSLAKPGKEGDKSLIASSALSFFFGPLGWFYAGSYKEAAIGSVAFLALWKILPGLLLSPLLFLLMPVSGIAGLVYAWQHNRSGERAPLLLGKDEPEDD